MRVRWPKEATAASASTTPPTGTTTGTPPASPKRHASPTATAPSPSVDSRHVQLAGMRIGRGRRARLPEREPRQIAREPRAQ